MAHGLSAALMRRKEEKSDMAEAAAKRKENGDAKREEDTQKDMYAEVGRHFCEAMRVAMMLKMEDSDEYTGKS